MGKPFAFKQFSVADDRCQMKVGTDGVLLGAWVDVDDVTTALDIGTGSGLIALMLAQRKPGSVIDAIEILENDVMQARENIARSPWHARITVHHLPVQVFNPATRYDLIVSNPPYFSKSQLPEIESRASARHTTALRHDELIAVAQKLLANDGKFAVIVPPSAKDYFLEKAKREGLSLARSTAFRSRPGHPIVRYLLELKKIRKQAIADSMCLYNGAFNKDKDTWTPEYHRLVQDFYL